MPTLPSEEDQALIALTSNMAGALRPALRKKARQNIPKVIAKNARNKPNKIWTPESVVKSIYRDTSTKTLQVYKLLGIDRDELLMLAWQGLNRAGIYSDKPVIAEIVKEKKTIRERFTAVGRYIKGIFIKYE